jgi:hypothetical protein
MELIMKTIRVSFYIIGSVFSISLLLFCRDHPGDQSRAITANREREELMAKLAEPVEYPIPVSTDLMEALQLSGAPYMPGISNSLSNADRYFTERSKALNLGVYGADLSYAVIYGMNQEIRNYLQVSNRLASDLNISTVYDHHLADNYLGHKDSLALLVSSLFHETFDFLSDNQRREVSLLVVTGSWIEGMYLAVQKGRSAVYNTSITNIILEQKDPLGNLLSLMENKYRSDELYQKLTEIHAFIKNLRSPMEEEVFELFAGMIENVRSDIIE